MSTRKNDNNSFAPYKHNDEVEALVNHMIRTFEVDKAEKDLNEALEAKMWISEPDKFQEIVDKYNMLRIARHFRIV